MRLEEYQGKLVARKLVLEKQLEEQEQRPLLLEEI